MPNSFQNSFVFKKSIEMRGRYYCENEMNRVIRMRGWCSCENESMGWLRLVGSLKTWVSFAKEPYKRDSILERRPIILRSLLSVATPYHCDQKVRIVLT